MSSDQDCLFCKIIAGDIPSTKVYEDEKAIAFLDISPVNPGHTLVIPREHHVNLLDCPGELAQHLIHVTKKIAPAILSATGAPAFNIVFRNGEEAGQEINHIHLHIVPRMADDGHKSFEQGSYEDGEIDTVGEKIRNNIAE